MNKIHAHPKIIPIKRAKGNARLRELAAAALFAGEEHRGELKGWAIVTWDEAGVPVVCTRASRMVSANLIPSFVHDILNQDLAATMAAQDILASES